VPFGRRLLKQRVDLSLREGGAGRELDGREVCLTVDPDVEDGRNLLERVADESRAALAACLLHLEDGRLHGRQTSGVRLDPVQVEILYCPT
jgi:hypothetical protein